MEFACEVGYEVREVPNDFLFYKKSKTNVIVCVY